MIRIERVIDVLPAGFETLRAEARHEGHTMIETLAAGWTAGALRFNQPGEALFAARVGTALAGVGGLTQEPAIPGALRMRRFYVRAGYRRGGVGRALVGELLRQAARPITANAASGSERFWEAFGFTPDRRDGRTHILR